MTANSKLNNEIMHRKKIVFFDIDYTLFDVTIFGEKVNAPLAEKLGIKDTKEFLKIAQVANEESKKEHGYYHPTTYLTLLKQATRSTIPLSELEEIYYKEAYYKESLYADALSVISALLEKDIEIGIFSKGHKPFQVMKILGLKKHVKDDKIFIFTDKLEKISEVLQPYKEYKIYLVDDMLLVLEEAKRINRSVSTVFIKRKIRAEFQNGFEYFKPDYVIEELEDLLPLV